MTPGIVERDGERRIRLAAGLELTVRRAVLLVVGVVVLFAVPDLTGLSDSVQLSIVHKGLLFGFAAVGLNLLLRHLHLTSFGHAAFFGTGAYTAALVVEHLGIQSFSLLVVLAVAGATAMAAVIGALSLRHTGLYFALLTLAFGQLLYSTALGQSELGGSDGLPVRPGPENQPSLFGAHFEPEVYSVLSYYVTVVVILAGLFVMWRIVNSPFTNALDAIGQDRTRARFIGLPIKRYVWVAFVISGVYGGFAGGLYAVVRQYVRPGETLYFLRSGDILFMAILGGFGTLLGPLVGGVVLLFLQDVGRDFTTYFDAVTGVALLVIVFVFPEGIVGSLQRGGVVRSWGAAVRNDPAVVLTGLRRAGGTLVGRLRRSVTDLRVLLFG